MNKIFKTYYQIGSDMNLIKASKYVYYKLSIIAILFFGIGLIYKSYTELDVINNYEKDYVVVKYNQELNKFKPEKLQQRILELKIKYPWVIYAQAYVESGNFSSPIFKENHNFLGMKLSALRASTAKGENRGHAYYDNWEDCLLDYALYYNKYLSNLNEEELYQFLQKYYAENPKYKIAIVNTAKKFKPLFLKKVVFTDGVLSDTTFLKELEKIKQF